jgi:sterol desaturase/sphingolipid hydroxylase (fatty acid hydroxylase superfamily)
MEIVLRFGGFFAIFMLMASWEYFRPLRKLSVSRKHRWPINLGLAVLTTLLMRFTVGAAAWQAAIWATEQHLGLFNSWVIPDSLNIALSLILLDLAIYAQHIAAHRWRWFWRLHQVHHTDLNLDTTTAIRFHPVEIMLSMLYKVILVLLLGLIPAQSLLSRLFSTVALYLITAMSAYRELWNTGCGLC